MLVFDQKHYEYTGVYTLTDGNESFTFFTVNDMKRFIRSYYRNKRLAITSYHLYDRNLMHQPV